MLAVCSRAAPEILINTPEAQEHPQDGSLCLSTPERVLEWGFSLSSPSTAPAQPFPSCLPGKTNTFAIYIYSEFQPPLNPGAGFGQYQPRSQSWCKNKQKKLLAEVYTLFLPG